ncbi:MAG: GreA/GreB family elongation factor [Verrucomicrobium sp.]|nr:GreA/GreB family elongation factor [Verrucomicrobium sp.]
MSSPETDALSPEQLAAIAPGTFCHHRSWGYGKIREHNTLLGQVIIDFKSKAGHSMSYSYALESLTLLPPTHIYARKTDDMAGLKGQAQSDPAAVVHNCIESLGSQASAENIQAALSPEVISAADWKKWWEGAKRALKKTGTYHIPTRKNEAFRILEAPLQEGVQAVEQFRASVNGGVEAQINTVAALSKHWGEIKDPAIADEVAQAVESTLSKLPKSQLAKGVELALLRDEFLAHAGQPAVEGAQSVPSLVPTTAKAFGELLEKISGPRQTKLLTVVAAARPEEWPALFLSALPNATGRMGDSVTTVFAAANRHQEVVDALQRLIRERTVSTDLLYWLVKNRDELFAPLFGPQLVMAILSVLEKDQMGDLKRGTKLYDLIHTDKEVMATLLREASLDDVRDVTRSILLTPVFKELDKRSLLAILIKLYPEMQELVVGDRTHAEDATLIVSWDSLNRRKLELEEIVTKKIPENSKEIGIARSYGDLRENHEFKAAKEMQTVLMRRKAELESLLVRAQGTDFANPDCSAVNIGTTVELTDTADGRRSRYTLLGAWDSEPAQGIISYLTPLAQALLKHPVGATLKIATEDGGEKEVRIESIAPYKA